MLLAQHSVGPLYAQHEDSVLLIAPPRMGKTHGFGINAILDAPGAAVCTSTKAEVVRLTAALRATGGRPVFVFDPENIADWPTQLRWSPIEGCQDPSVAIERAPAFVSGAPLADGARNERFFQETGDTVLRCLLHAAALGRKTMRDLARWAADFDNPEPLNILSSHDGACPGWYGELRTYTRGAPTPCRARR